MINKTGSSILAISCEFYKKPLYVISDKSKIKETSVFEEEEKDPKEIYSGRTSQIKIKNFYFEEIEKKLITKLFTD